MKAPTMDEWVEQIGNKAINEFVYEGRTLKEWIDLIASGKLVMLPDNATNGDVIKAVFPDAENIRVDNGLPLNFVLEFELHRNYKNWWNSPYKAGDTEESDAEFMCKAMSKTVNKHVSDNNFITGF